MKVHNMVDPISARSLRETKSSQITPEAISTRADELVASANMEIEARLHAASWNVRLTQDAMHRDSLEYQAARMAAARFNELPEYRAQVREGRTSHLEIVAQ
jgi:hypothetical protein